MAGNYVPGTNLNQWTNAYPSEGNAGPLLACDGSPEGQIFGAPGARCIDRGTNNLYVKVAGTGKFGWQANGVMIGYMEVVAGAS